jgi:hypothetical protein
MGCGKQGQGQAPEKLQVVEQLLKEVRELDVPF